MLRAGVEPYFATVEVDHECEEDVYEVAESRDESDEGGKAEAEAADGDAVVEAVGAAADGKEDFCVGRGDAEGDVFALVIGDGAIFAGDEIRVLWLFSQKGLVR